MELPSADDKERSPRMERSPSWTSQRPWFTLYDPSEDSLLARQIWRTTDDDDEQEQQLLLPFEMWLAIAMQLQTVDGPGKLGEVCRGLRPICRHPELWEHRVRAAFSARGFLDSDALLRPYAWSWRKMFMERRRLRFDGVYFISTTKMLKGLNEGRGMKETDKDFYQPGGMRVTYHRIFRFWPSGDCFVFLTGNEKPESLGFRRAVQAVTPARKASLQQRPRGASWGRYELREAEAETTLVRAAPPCSCAPRAPLPRAPAPPAPLPSLTSRTQHRHVNAKRT